MKYAFKELPGAVGDYLRPTLPVVVEGLERAPLLCLLDTGALHNRFAAWLAEAVGIELDGAEEHSIALGGFHSRARLASVSMRIGEDSWHAPVWFCEPWPLAFQLLGQEGFFRFFDVSVRAARYEIEVAPAS